MLSGSGETTCGNTRCRRHSPEPDDNTYHLNTVQLPFAYIERGESKNALVKVVLCDRCIKKLMYKRTKDKEAARVATASNTGGSNDGSGMDAVDEVVEDISGPRSRTSRGQHEISTANGSDGCRRNRSRSRSPRDRHRSKRTGRRRSRSPQEVLCSSCLL